MVYQRERERVKTCRRFAGEGLLWQIERRGAHAVNRKHPEWIPRDGHAWPGRAGLDLEGGGLRGSCTSSWTERERQKDDRERPPGADRCSPPLQLRPHSWPGSGDISLPLPPCVRPLTPIENTCSNYEELCTTGYGNSPCSLFLI